MVFQIPQLGQVFVMIKSSFTSLGRMSTIKSSQPTLNATIPFTSKMLSRFLFLPWPLIQHNIGKLKSVPKEYFSSQTSIIHQEIAPNSQEIFNHAANSQLLPNYFKKDGMPISLLISVLHSEMKSETLFMLTYSESITHRTNQLDTLRWIPPELQLLVSTSHLNLRNLSF